jgi:putative ABC transport system substrate-binding protein
MPKFQWACRAENFVGAWYGACANNGLAGMRRLPDYPRRLDFGCLTPGAVLPEGYAKFMKLKLSLAGVLLGLLAAQPLLAQPAKPPRIGVLVPGTVQYEIIDGLREGLKDLGLEENRQFTLAIKNVKGEGPAAEKEALAFEKDNVSLLLALTTPVITHAKLATARTPIVFCIGSDPVSGGLVDSFAKPGGRLTGVHYLVRDLTAKRLEILKEILPKMSRVLTLYDPTNRVAVEGATLAREEAKRIGVKFIERHVGSIDELKAQMPKMKAGDADAFLFPPDPMIGTQSALIIETAKAIKLPTMFQEQSLVAQGALAAYGQNYREVGRAAAKYVQRVLHGANPAEMKIETIDSVELAVNLQTAKQIGVTIPPQVLARAKKVIK